MFFFCKQKTAYEMRISDWSSDVCSSDLYQAAEPPELVRAIGCSCVASPVAQALVGAAQPVPVPEIEAEVAVIVTVMAVMMAGRDQPFSDRQSVVSGKGVSVRVALGGRRNITTKNKNHQNQTSIHKHID